MDVQLSDQHYQVLHVDSKSLLRWNAPLKLNGRDNDHPNIPDDTGGKHRSKLIAWSDRFIVDRNPKYDNPETNVLRYYISFNLEISTVHSNYHTTFPLEYRDEGAYFYRKYFLLLRDKHQNWFGIQSNGEAVAVSVARVLIPKGNKHDNIYPILEGGPPLPVVEHPLSDHNSFIQMNSSKLTSGELQTAPNDPREIANGSGSNSVQRNRSRDKKASEKASEIGLVSAWLVIVRREKGCDLRCCVVDQSPEGNNLQRGSSAGSKTYVAELQRASAAEIKKAGQKTSGLSRTNSKKNNYAKTVITMDPHTQAMLKFVTLGQINPEELQLGEANTAVYGKLASMDELEETKRQALL
ncbi:hypothetical protein FGIG_05956 [Fasciola gigantica]|uniref:Uncharacterized protein n=1 Tax=Fasciola gigantica TaxID=46835 RepID=A0A504YRI8_FASGI|nr:hypothetical protein FGIG_05956 [Fasciola gigantica]